MGKLLKKIKQTNRLAYYRDIILYAKMKSYNVISLYDWYTTSKNIDDKFLILRHDVDYDWMAAYLIYKLEKDLGVRSSFYFRWSSMNSKLMIEMMENGFEVSLHYETLSNYAKVHNLYHKNEITNQILRDCRNLLSEEICLFENKYWKIHSLCPHGDKRNKLLGLNNKIILNQDLKKQHSIMFDSYDKKIMNGFDAYISDSSIYSDFRWQNYNSPIELFKQNRKDICMLTHPIHWGQSYLKNIKMLTKVYFDNRHK